MSLKALKAGIVLPIIVLFVLISAGWARSDPAENQVWEYRYLQLTSSQAHEFEKTLNQQGGQSFELVSVVRENPNGTFHFFFKRAR